MATNYLNPNFIKIDFDEDSEFKCTQCGYVHSYSDYEYTPWMCGCGNDLTSAFGAEDLCEYPDEENYDEELKDEDDPDYLPNPNLNGEIYFGYEPH